MIKNYIKLLFLITLVIGRLLTLRSNNWFRIWMGLEINLISFIPLITNYKNRSSERAIIYFIVQRIGSILFIASILITSIMIFKRFIEIIIIISISLKIGIAPIHLWIPEIIEKLSWLNCIILITWQKLAPLSIISYIENKIIIILAAYRTVIGAIGGINQTSTRKIIAFSSINHLGWITSTILFNNEIWIKYFVLYRVITLITLRFIWINSIFFINQFKSNNQIINKINITIMIIRLGGLPPFLGFLPKWLVIQTLIVNNIYIIILIIIIRALLTLFYYLRIIRRIIIINQYSIKWELKNKKVNMIVIINIIINIILPAVVTIRIY